MKTSWYFTPAFTKKKKKKKKTTPKYQRHLTTTSLTLLGKGLWVLQTVGMVLQVGGRIGVHPKPLMVILPVIVTARNQKWLPQLFASHAYKKKLCI